MINLKNLRVGTEVVCVKVLQENDYYKVGTTGVIEEKGPSKQKFIYIARTKAYPYYYGNLGVWKVVGHLYELEWE
jgi:hypothetical protein